MLRLIANPKDVRKSILRDSFREFAREFWDEVPGAAPVQWNWHIDVICDELQRIAKRVYYNEPKEHDLIINCPPGASKSSLASILFQAWTWTFIPHARHITASHTDALVLDLSNKCRAVVKSEKYQEYFPHVQLDDTQDTKGYFRITTGGDRLTCTVGGKTPMGFHAHFISVDDPIDPQKVLSQAELEQAKEFMLGVIPTRKVDKAVSVTSLIMQRLGVGDPSEVMMENASLKEGESIRHVCLPAEESDLVSPPEIRDQYVDGLLDPVRMPRHVLQAIKIDLGALRYAAQFEQNPRTRDGGMFKAEYFNKRVKAAPYHCKRIRYWDRASTEDGGCNTAGVLMAYDKEEGNFYVEHVIAGQWEPYARNNKMLAMALRDRSKYGPRCEPTIWTEREGGSWGRDAWLYVAKKLAGFNVREDQPKGDKVTRAEPWSAQCAAGNVYVVDDGTWDVDAYVEEHCTFPLAEMKDRVDASSGAFNLLLGKTRPTLRSYSLDRRKDQPLSIAICTLEELKEFLTQHQCLLLGIFDPTEEANAPPSGIVNVVDHVRVQFADVDPQHYQDCWEEKIAPWGQTCEEICMKTEHGQAFWKTLKKRRHPPVEVVVVYDSGGGGLATSVAMAIADVSGLKRDVLYSPSRTKEDLEGLPPNAYVHQQMKVSRSRVL